MGNSDSIVYDSGDDEKMERKEKVRHEEGKKRVRKPTVRTSLGSEEIVIDSGGEEMEKEDESEEKRKIYGIVKDIIGEDRLTPEAEVKLRNIVSEVLQ